MAYFNFDLKLSGEGPRAFYVEVLGSPQAMRTDPLAASVPEELLARWRGLAAGGRDCERAGVELGRALHAALFPPAVREVWHACQRHLAPRDGLRLRLDIRSPQLAAVPWELLHDGGWHVSMTKGAPVVRHPFGHPPIPPSPDPGLLNLLLATSAPHDATPLPAAEREVEAVMSSFSGLKAEGKAGRVDLLRNVTKESLRRLMQEHEYHVLHFIGHGDFEDEKGYLAFEGEDGNVELFGAQSLAYRLKGSALRLLFLNSCKSAVASRRGGLLGVAQGALAAGVPAAVAMQEEIGDASAAAFAREFYRALAAGQALEECVRLGRLKIFEATELSRADWAVPVLFSNAEEGLLWELPEAEAKREEGRRPVVVYEQHIRSKGNNNRFVQNEWRGAGGGEDD